MRLYAARDKDGYIGYVAGDRPGNLVHRIERRNDGYSADDVAAAAVAGRDNAVRPRFAGDGRVVGDRGGFRAAFNRLGQREIVDDGWIAGDDRVAGRGGQCQCNGGNNHGRGDAPADSYRRSRVHERGRRPVINKPTFG